MAIKNESLTKAFDAFINFEVYFTGLVGYYIIPSISLIGFILNIIALIVLTNRKFKERDRFKYVIVKIGLEMIGSLMGIGFQNYLKCIIDNYILGINCTETGSYIFQFFRALYKYVGVVLYIWTGINEILLTYDRYLILKAKKNWFNEQSSFKYILLICGILTSVIYLPYALSSKISLVVNSTNLYYLETTEFALSNFYQVYTIILQAVVNIILLIVIIVFSVVVLVKFKKFIRNHSSLANNHSSSVNNIQENIFKKTELNMLKMTITLSILLSIMRFTDLATTILFRLSILSRNLSGNATNISNKLFLLYLGNLCYVIIFITASENFFVLFVFNKQFRENFKSVYLTEKVNFIRSRISRYR